MERTRFDTAHIPFDGSSFVRRLVHESTDVLQEAIAQGAPRCQVRILPESSKRLDSVAGREYFRVGPLDGSEQLAEARAKR